MLCETYIKLIDYLTLVAAFIWYIDYEDFCMMHDLYDMYELLKLIDINKHYSKLYKENKVTS